jgi:hypothetical protein
LVEHVLGKDEVTGSIPVLGSSRLVAAGVEFEVGSQKLEVIVPGIFCGVQAARQLEETRHVEREV